MDTNCVRTRIRALGRAFTPDQIQASQAIYAELLDKSGGSNLSVQRDISYGPYERNLLDVHYSGSDTSLRRPILMFVHGGGFVGGNKTRPNSPFYDNVGLWAASHGMVGVNITYRLAPKDPWPSGPEDVAAAVRWIDKNAAAFGGEARQLFAMGQSAGGVHVASYIAHNRFHGSHGHGLAGGIMLSALYDLTRTEHNDMHKAYFGNDPTRYAEMSSLPGLSRTSLPLLFSVSELDPLDFHKQAAALAAGFLETRGALPRMLYLTDHNHISSVLQLGTPCDTLGSELKNFVDGVCEGSIRA
jgi:arylformamidase